MTNCKYCGKELESNKSAGGHITWCKNNPNVPITKNKISIVLTGKKLSTSTKNKISESRKKYLNENPDKVPYKLYHSSKKSWPEITFEKYLIKNEITGWVYNYSFSRYSLDFAFPEWKLDIEIDGNTHNLDKVKKIDKERDDYLLSNGWTVIRFKASDIRENVYTCINTILLFINYPKLIEIPKEFLNKKFERNLKIQDKLEIRNNKIIELNNKYIIIINAVIFNYGNKFGIVQKIADELNVSHTKVRRLCKKFEIKLNSERKLSYEMKQNLIKKLTGFNEGPLNDRSKIYLIQFPNGEIKKIKGLNKFCKDNNLTPSSLRYTKNKKSSYNGYKIIA